MEQLDLFNSPNAFLADCYTALANFDFNKANQVLNEVGKTFPKSPEIALALGDLNYWQTALGNTFQTNSVEKLEQLYATLQSFQFRKAYNHNQFHQRIIARLIAAMQTLNCYSLHCGISQADLLISIKDFQTAQNVINNQLNKTPESISLKLDLANLLWQRKKWAEARKFYALVLLQSPNTINASAIANEKIKQLIEKEGAYLAPAFAYLIGELPLLEPKKYTEYLGAQPLGCIELLELIQQAKLHQTNGNQKEIVASRKRIKEASPTLFQLYMKKLG